MHRSSTPSLALWAALAFGAVASATEPSDAEPSAAEPSVQERVQKGAREAADAVVGAGEKVSAKIQGRSAGNELAPGMHTNTGLGYGSAGCGLGSILFEPGTGFTQVFAATTNSVSGTQTFGITSGTSNCGNGAAGADAARAFVETNRVALAKDIARGSGETIASLARLGCSAVAG